METDNSNELGAGANVDSIDSVHVTYLPLVDYEGKLLPVHFLSAEEVMSCLVAMPHRKLNGDVKEPPMTLRNLAMTEICAMIGQESILRQGCS